MLRRAASLALAVAALASCGNTFEPASSINSLRVIGVQVDPPYGKPGQKASLKILYFDGSKRAFDAQGNRKRTPQVLWLGGCHDPPGDLYYGCFPILAQLFATLAPPGSGGAGGSGGAPPGLPPGGLPGGLNPLELVGFGDSFRVTIPADIITRRPPQELAAIQAQGNTPYGLSYVFFAVCGGTVRPIPIDQATNGLPLGCFDPATNERLGDDDFVIGYTPIYTYDSISNKNPVIDGVQFEGVEGMKKPCSEGCAAGSRCGSQGVCLPVVPHCTERKLADCPQYKVKPILSRQNNVEIDAAAQPIDGKVPDEIMWVSFSASDGVLENDTVLVNDAIRGWVFDANEGAKWSAPNAPAGESRIWVVARDNRGGTSWTWQDIFVD